MRRYCFQIVAVVMLGILLRPNLASSSTTSRQLNAVLPELRFDGVAFTDAIDFIRDVSGANINVNWRALEAAGISKDTPLNIRLRSISLRKALDLMLSQAGAGSKLGFTIDQGVIEITTQELIDSIMYTRVYNVEDLLMVIPDFNDAPSFDLTAMSTNSGQSGGQSGGSQQSMFNSSQTNNNGDKGKTKTERANDLMGLIRDLIQPDVWQENGGKAAIRYFNVNLIVTAPRSVQEAIGGPFD